MSKNITSTVLEQVHGVTESDNPFFDKLEFVFGTLKPGETRTWETKVKLPAGLGSRSDLVTFKVGDQGGLGSNILASVFAKVVSQNKPHFAYSYQLDDRKGGIFAFLDDVYVVCAPDRVAVVHEALREELEAALGAAFAFVAPAAATVPPLLAEGTTGDPSASLPFAHAGLPSVTLPVGRDHATNLPVCLQFVGRAGADEALLQFAARLEEKAFPALSS